MKSTYPLTFQVLGLALLAGLLSPGIAQAQGPRFASSVPAANAIAAPRQAVFQQNFTGGVPLNATAAQGLRVFSAQRGGQRVGYSGTTSASSNQLTFNQTAYASRPGETVSVSLTSGITSAGGQALTNPSVYQFTTNVGGTGKGVFSPLPIAVLSSVPVGETPVYIKLADVDNDGDLDMLTCNDGTYVPPTAASTVSLRVNNGTGIFTTPTNGSGTISVGASPLARCLTMGDVDNDGNIDLVVGNEGTGDVSIRLNTGGGFFYDPGGARGTQTTLAGVRGVALGDLDADGDLDLVVASADNSGNGGVVYVRFNDGTGLFTTPAANGLVPVNGQTRNLTLADVDADGDLDMLVTNVAANTVSLRLNNGAGVFAEPATNPNIAVNGNPISIMTGDVDGDGDLDFVTTGNGSACIRLNTNGTFAPPAVAANGTVAIPGFPFDVALGDLDADGDLDMLVPTGNNTGGVAVRFNNGSGVFTASSFPAYAEAVVNESANGVALGDVDGDGDLDFVTANQFGDNASVRLNGPGPEISVRVALAPTFAAGPVYASGSTFNFGSVPVNTATAQQFFYVKNLSTTDNLTLSGLSAAGAINSYGGFTAPYVLGPGDSTNFSVSMRPTAVGLNTGSITIANDDLDESSYVINLTVTGDAPPTAVTWTGALDTRWAAAGNWSPAVVPGATTNALIPVVPNQPVVRTATATCATLTMQAGTTLTFPVAVGHLTVNGNLQSSGTVAMANGTLELQGLQNQFGTLAATGGTVAFTGPTLQLIGGSYTFWNLTVGGTGSQQVRQDGNTHVKRMLRLARNFDTNNTAFFLDSDANGTAMVVNAGGIVSGTGLVYAQRYIGGPNAGLGYRHLSAPSRFTRLVQLNATGFTPVLNSAYNTTGNTARPFPNIFSYDEARQGAAGVPGTVGFDQGWLSPASTNDSFVPGRGYTMNLAGTALPTIVTGFLNDGDVAVGALSHSGSGAFAGYHLLGNPYPAPIDWDSVARPTGLDNAVYVFRSTGQYTGFYDSYVNGLGTLAGGEIASMQGFFVHVSQAVPSFSFTNAARKTVYASPSFQRSAGPRDARPLLALALRPAAGGEADQAFIYFETGATAARDAAYDAGKLPNTSGLNLASQLGADDYAINGLPLLGTAPLVLPLTVSVPAAGSYELAVDQLANFAPGTTLFLRDAVLQTLTPLTASTTYAFTLAGYTAPGRFAIEFRPGGALATAAQLLEAQVQVFPNPAKAAAGATVAAPAGARVAVLNALGQVVLPTQVVGHAATLPLPTAGLAAGLYVLRIHTEAGEVSRRLVVE